MDWTSLWLYQQTNTPHLLVHTGSYWLILVHTGWYWLILVDTGSYWLILVDTGSYWFMLVHVGSYRFIQVHTGSYWFILVHTGSYWIGNLRSGNESIASRIYDLAVVPHTHIRRICFTNYCLVNKSSCLDVVNVQSKSKLRHNVFVAFIICSIQAERSSRFTNCWNRPDIWHHIKSPFYLWCGLHLNNKS